MQHLQPHNIKNILNSPHKGQANHMVTTKTSAFVLRRKVPDEDALKLLDQIRLLCHAQVLLLSCWKLRADNHILLHASLVHGVLYLCLNLAPFQAAVTLDQDCVRSLVDVLHS